MDVGDASASVTASGRKRVLANGSLLEVQRNASHPSLVDFGSAAESRLSAWGPSWIRYLCLTHTLFVKALHGLLPKLFC